MALKFRRVRLPDGTTKLERVPDSPEEVEAKKKLKEEHIKKDREYFNDLLKKKGFKRNIDYLNYLAKKRGFKNHSEYQNSLSVKKGFKNNSDYRNDLFKKKGFDNYNDYRQLKRYENGESLPMNINENCSSYLGVYVAERLLPEIFENVERTSYGFSGYDGVCKKGYKIDVKSSTLYTDSNRWLFNIKQNTTPDYFLLMAFNNRNDLNVSHIWLIKSEELLNTKYCKNKKLNEFKSLTITNYTKYIDNYKKYELTDKLDKVKEICNKFKEIKLTTK